MAETTSIDDIPPGKNCPGNDTPAVGRFMSTLYGELCAIAANSMKLERSGHTLQPTALVHEAFLRLAEVDEAKSYGELQFRAAASEMMRRVLVDHARKRNTAKRGKGRVRFTLTGQDDPFGASGVDLLEFNDALETLERLNSRHRRIVELRVFGGMTYEQMADLMGISTRAIGTDWAMARSWLHEQMFGKKT